MNNKFEPYQQVLARDTIGGVWRAKFFSNYTEDNKYLCTDDMEWEMCIPYEENKHLLGTRDNLEKKQDFEFGQKVRVWDGGDIKINAIFIEKIKGQDFPYKAMGKESHSIDRWIHCEAYEW